MPASNWDSFIVTLGQSISDSAFWVGFVLVVIFALNRFAISDSTSDESDPPVVARSFTTRFRYYLSAVTYAGCYEIAYGILVGIGSFPLLQKLLIQWIGSTGPEGDTIGTPAWAALVVTTALPAAPGFSAIDKAIRNTLQDFASIPYKARGLAREIMKCLSERDETRQKTEQLKWLSRAIDKLQNDSHNSRNARAYSDFFKQYLGVLQHAKEKRDKLEKALTNDPEAKAELLTNELEGMVNNTARFLSCALLQSESSERHARSVIRETLDLESLPRLEFDFNPKQILLGIALCFVLPFIAGLVTLGLALPKFSDITSEMRWFIFGWSPYAMLMLIPAFIFAAGVQLYFLDLRQLQSRSPHIEDIFLALTGLFVISFGVGILPPLVGMALNDTFDKQHWYSQVLPFGLLPALTAIVFYVLATRHLVGSTWGKAAIDFVVFASVAGVSTWFATWVAFPQGNGVEISAARNIADVAKVPGFTNAIALRVFPVTAAVLVGVMGAFQCHISRRKPITSRNQGQQEAPRT